MREYLVYGKTLPDAYHAALQILNDRGETVDCSDWNDDQKEVSITFEVEDPMGEPGISKCCLGGPEELQQYVMEMTDGILDFEVEKGNWAYTYHQRYADQIPFVVDDLKRNASSRRAVALVRDKAADIGSDDPACLQHLQFFVRDGKLDLKVLFRSNDAVKACFMNAFALIRVQQQVADQLGIPVGRYSHRANSFHCYGKDFDALSSYAARIAKVMADPSTTGNPFDPDHPVHMADPDEIVTYSYEDDWKEDMEDAIPGILKKVEELKNR